MKISLSYARKKTKCELSEGERLRLYAVPAEYSEDGLYLAVWQRTRYEPVPACDAAQTTLLADLECGLAGADAAPVLLEHYLVKGVKYAQA